MSGGYLSGGYLSGGICPRIIRYMSLKAVTYTISLVVSELLML